MSDPNGATGGPDLIEIIKRFMEAGWRRRYLICIPIVLMIPLGLLAARSAPKTYEAKTILLLQEPSTANPFLDDFAIGLNLKDRIGALRSLLRSEHILLSVLSERGRINENASPAQVALEVRRLADAVSVELAGSNLIELRLTGNTPDGMGALLQTVSDRFLDQLLSPAKSRLEATRTFLQQQMKDQRAHLDKLETRLAALRDQHGEDIAALISAKTRQIERLETDLRSARAQLSAAQLDVEAAQRKLISANPAITELDQRIAQARGELALLSARYTDTHSSVQSVERQLDQLEEERGQVVARLSRQPASATRTASTDKLGSIPAEQLARVQDARAQAGAKAQVIAELQTELSAERQALSRLEPIRAQAGALKADVGQARARYDALRERFENASISYALGQFQETERVKVIDPPADPKAPVTPPGIIYLVASIFGGVSLGIGLALVSELLDQRLRTARDFAGYTDKLVVARLPRVIDPATNDDRIPKFAPR
jgi:polysaccharide chain length determinant protein (PEP-CTERM system associated)